VTDDQQARPQGPEDPHGPGGIDAPAPPGGPQRADAPAGPDTPGTPAKDPGEHVQRVTKPEGTGSVPPPQSEQHGDQRDVEQATQLENAQTAQDEPSDGSGGE
jgi:hypothetical protein